jgi:hypothetical protein
MSNKTTVVIHTRVKLATNSVVIVVFLTGLEMSLDRLRRPLEWPTQLQWKLLQRKSEN